MNLTPEQKKQRRHQLLLTALHELQKLGFKIVAHTDKQIVVELPEEE